MNCMVFDGFGGMGVWLFVEGPSIHNILGFSWVVDVFVLDGCVGCQHLLV